MKKIYIIPQMQIVLTAQNLPIAASGDLQYNDGTITGDLHDGEASGDGLVKGHGAGNVWNDDWSK